MVGTLARSACLGGCLRHDLGRGVDRRSDVERKGFSGRLVFLADSRKAAAVRHCNHLQPRQNPTRKGIRVSQLVRNSAGDAVDGDADGPPPGCSRFKVDLGRPLGIVFEENNQGNIFVGEIATGGNAEKSGVISVGDQLIATSAVVYNNTDSYGGVLVRKGMEKVRLSVKGERFDTVMAAIGTHPAYLKVTLEFQKC